jgi:hypothetical protein
MDPDNKRFHTCNDRNQGIKKEYPGHDGALNQKLRRA